MMASGTMMWFSCCVTRRPPVTKGRRPRIDRSMIGLPTDFRHTGHIGSGDVSANNSHANLNSVQTQMSTKGGYDHTSPVEVSLNLTNIQNS